MVRIMALLGMLAVTGCYTTKMHYGSVLPEESMVHKRFQHTIFWGLISPGSIDLEQVCGDDPVVAVRSQIAGLGLLANWLTVGIYAPVTVTVTCAR